MRFNHLTDTHLRLYDRKNSLGARGFGLNLVDKIHIGSAVVDPNCYQLV